MHADLAFADDAVSRTGLEFAPSVETPQSDDERDALVLEVERLLIASAYRSLRRVHCCCQGGTVVLGGNVPSFYLKQIAQTLVMQIAGIDRVRNCIVVETVAD
jgi:hypothetical protein